MENKNKEITNALLLRIVQKYSIKSWLLPCSLRSHRTANPRPKIGFAIFRLCPPTTLQETVRWARNRKMKIIREKSVSLQL